jgi:hypothetical protein
MRLFLSALAIFAAVVCLEKPADAQGYPWCAYYDVWGGSTNCGFVTYQQCLATVRGVGGSCGPNPSFPSGPQRVPRRYYH